MPGTGSSAGVAMHFIKKQVYDFMASESAAALRTLSGEPMGLVKPK